MVHTQVFSELTNRHDGWERQMLEGLTSAYLQETLAAVVQGQCLRDLFTCMGGSCQQVCRLAACQIDDT
jgi:hypothetical protein